MSVNETSTEGYNNILSVHNIKGLRHEFSIKKMPCKGPDHEARVDFEREINLKNIRLFPCVWAITLMTKIASTDVIVAANSALSTTH
jgi:hypothetical protein